MQRLKGAMTALITPFRNGALDEAKYAQLIQRQIDNGIDVVVPVGTTGESATLSHDEHKRCIEIAVEVCKGSSTKVMAGAGSNSTREAIDLATFAQKAGADAILSVSPYYNKPTQEGLYQHYKAIAQAIDIPVLLYNVPGRTGVDIAPDTIFRLFDEVENIYGVKEATGSIERCVELLAKRPELYVISGDDAINYPIIANGGMGVISVSANLMPHKMSMLVHAGLAGQFDTAKMVNDELFDLNKVLFIESNPIPIKAAMYIAGLLDTLEYRLPLVPPSKEHMRKIEEVLQRYKVI
ncbi:MAG: 4-hydroxy-tetrahydrodipicolinate synthase [Epsilonproteobacteria bacterium]|nr:4-hydroxy-tetrahydrodipicolinate synthase [Campylobacterota bacterium]NPA64774.1 4-hydroxy-tetrahydrodipicolinate synthase [Campylobacterota bacterium]